MAIYKLCKKSYQQEEYCMVEKNGNVYIPFDPANTDYQRFKTEIEAGEAELQDAEGVLMTSEAAKAFVATLP